MTRLVLYPGLPHAASICLTSFPVFVASESGSSPIFAEVKPKVVILLGEKVCSAVEKKLDIKLKRWRGFEYFATEYNDIWYLPVQHPSYIYVYKRKEAEKYVKKVAEAIGRIFVDDVCTIFNAVKNTASEKVVKKNKKI